MANLFADEDFPFATVTELRRLGHDVLTALQAGLVNQGLPDQDILTYAVRLGRAVVTQNRNDFKKLHKKQGHCGIIACSQNIDFVELAKRIHDSILKESPLDNKLVNIYQLHTTVQKRPAS